ncbi:MAG TPA: hypothetical protein VFT29_02360 [Gemmatimonadaceae bacterium]|nr:hypothetical protein [Gemmatimonadaceae bacterium]
MRAALALCVTVVAAACRYQPTPVPLLGAPADIAAMAGEWSGEYFSAQSGRSGSISFSIVAGKDTAFGDVVMTPWRGQPLVAADVASRAHALHSPAPDVLKVQFVRVRGGEMEGALEPYLAPDCQCAVTTVFQGVLRGNTIRGRYVTTGAVGLRQEGDWSVARKLVATR